MDDVRVVPVIGARERNRFIDFSAEVYRHLPHSVVPLRIDAKSAVDPKRSPFLKENPHQAYLAMRNGRVVGRIMAIENREHLKRYQDGVGHFGFLEFLPERKILAALLDEAAKWLSARGLSRMLGPMSPSINHEVGVLVEGADHPPTYMMNYAPAYYDHELRSVGMAKAMDIFSFVASTAPEDQPLPLNRMLEQVRESGRLKLRRVDLKKYNAEIDLLVDIFNDGWSQNWGSVPLSAAEARSLGDMLRPLIVEQWLTFVEAEGEAMAVVLQMPDINQAIADLNGRLLPFGWLKLLRRLRIPTVTHSRLLMLGVRKEFHGKTLGPLSALLLLDDSMRVAREHGITTCEVGWVLETNKAILSVIDKFKVDKRKRFRLYERPI